MSDVKAGGTAPIARGCGHGILNAGDDDLEIVQTWNPGKFEDFIGKHRMATAPKHLLSNNLAGLPASTVDKLDSRA